MSAMRQLSSYYNEQLQLPAPRRVPAIQVIPEKQPVASNEARKQSRTLILLNWSALDQDKPSADDANSLSATYVIENRVATGAFVRRNHLWGLLLDAVTPLKDKFGPESIKVLTLVTDDEGSESLFCLIMAPGGMVEARQQLRAFDEDWWIEHAVLSAGKLNFDIELI
jgi:hypothetical protein